MFQRSFSNKAITEKSKRKPRRSHNHHKLTAFILFSSRHWIPYNASVDLISTINLMEII